MAFDMKNASKARSSSGVNKLINEVNANINTVIKALDGQKYTDFVNNLNKAWSGASKDNFMRDLNKQKETAKSNLRKLQQQIARDLQDDKAAFLKADSIAYSSKK